MLEVKPDTIAKDMKKLDAKQLRVSEPTEKELKKIKRNPIYLIIDEVLDTYNIGSMFRLADAVAMKKVYLCGNSSMIYNAMDILRAKGYSHDQIFTVIYF